MNVILVHLGDIFFDYINDCIDQINKYNDCSIFLVISNKHSEKIQSKKIIPIFIEDVIKDGKHQHFEIHTRLDRNSIGASGNKGFWKYATERFFYVENVMRKFNLKNTFHLENDNLIYFNLKDYINIFEENYEIAAVFDNDNRCIPGFMYFKNADYLGQFTQFIIENNGPCDMELLPMFNRKYNLIKNLPVIPADYTNLRSQTNLTTATPEKYSNNIDKFNSVFDGAAIGQYLGGYDPFVESSIGFVNESSLFKVSDFTFEFIDKIPYMKYNGKMYKVNNLHVHSKRLNVFV